MRDSQKKIVRLLTPDGRLYAILKKHIAIVYKEGVKDVPIAEYDVKKKKWKGGNSLSYGAKEKVVELATEEYNAQSELSA